MVRRSMKDVTEKMGLIARLLGLNVTRSSEEGDGIYLSRSSVTAGYCPFVQVKGQRYPLYGDHYGSTTQVHERLTIVAESLKSLGKLGRTLVWDMDALK